MEEIIEEIVEEEIKVVEDIEMPKEQPIKVYVKLNTNNEIIEVASSIFLNDTTGWVEIDSGFGDKFAHAQSQYFDKPLMNDGVTYNYSYENGKVKEV